MLIDLKTLIFFDAFVYAIGAVAAAFIWYQRPKHFAGTGLWLASMLLEAVGTVLLILRGQVPDYISIVLANTLVWAGVILINIGLQRFLGKKSSQVHNYILLAVFIIIHAYFTYAQPSLFARNLNTNVAIIIFSIQCCWTLLWRVTPLMRGAARMVGVVFGLFAAVSLARIIANIMYPPQSNDFFQSGMETTIAFIALVLGAIVLVYGLIILVNRRIFGEALSYMEELKIKKDLLDEAGNLAKVGGWEYDVKTNQLTWTEEVYRIHEKDLNFQPTLDKSLSLYVPETVPIISQAIQRAIENGDPFDLELPFIAAGGNRRWVRVLGKAYRKDGNIVKVGGIFQDISERKQAEDALRDSEKRYRDLSNELPQIVCEVDKEGNITFANNNAFKSFGYSREEVEAGMTIWQVIEPKDLDIAKKNVLAILSGENIEGFEYSVRRKDGSTFPVLAYSRPIISTGKPIGLIIIAIDMTERKKTEAALRDSEKRYREFADQLPQIVCEMDIEGKVTFANSNAFKAFGYTREEMEAGITIWHMIEPEDVEAAKKNVLITLGGVDLGGIEYTARRKDGSTFPILAYSSLIISAGKPTGLRTITIDITERRKMEDQLRLSKERFSKVFQNSPDSITLTSLPEGRIIEANDSLYRTTGYSSDEVIGRTTAELNLWYNPADRSKFIELIAKKRRVINIEADFRKKSGAVINTLISAELIDLMGEKYMLSVIRDITERKQAEDALRDSEKRYREFVDQLPQIVCEMDVEGKVTFANSNAFKAFGYSREEMEAGLTIWQMLVPEDVEAAKKNVLITVGGVDLGGIEYTARRKDGSTFPILAYSSFTISAGKPTGLRTIVVDITERKKMETQLRLSEERFSKVFRNSPDAITLTSLVEGNIADANESLYRTIGYSADEVLGRTVIELNLWYEPAERKHFIELLQKHGRVVNMEADFRTKSGARVNTLISAELIELTGEKYILSIIRDVTERKQAENALLESEERFRQFFSNEPAYCYMISREGNILDINEAALKTLCYEKEELVGKPIRKIYAPESLPKMNEILQRWGETGEINEEEMVIITKNGNRRSVLLSARANRNGAGEIVNSISVQQDITERKQLEHALVEEKKLIEVTLQSTGDGVIAADLEGRVTMLNRVAEQLTGWTQKEATGKPVQEVFHIIEEKTRVSATNTIEEVLKANKIISLSERVVLVSKDGTERIIADSGAPIRDELGKLFGIVLVFRDVTHLQKLEDEVQKITKLESVGTLAGGIAHDFNNLLTAILGNINLANRKLQEGSELKEILQEVEKASLQARRLTQQLLTFARGGEPVKKMTAMDKLIKDAALFASRGSAVQCQFSVPDDLWNAEVDEGQINQVISNLVINGIQAMPQGGTIEINAVNITVTAKKDLGKKLPLPEGDYIRIAVADHGVGISPKHIQKIFDPYFTTKEKGSGLGLATSYSIVRKHGGHIGVESKINTGSTFYIYLPASKESIKEVKEETKKEVKTGKGRILVMDDEAAVRDVASRMLQYLGYNDVAVAADGEEAIKLYVEAMKTGKSFDLVILDLTIPGGMGGKETMKKLVEIDPEVTAVVSSGYSPGSTMADYKKYGFKGVVAKPYTLQQLGDTIHKVII